MIGRTAGTVIAVHVTFFANEGGVTEMVGFFDTVMELQCSMKGGNRIYIGEEDSMKLPIQLVYHGNLSLSSASIQTAGNQLIVKNDPSVPIKPSIASEVTLLIKVPQFFISEISLFLTISSLHRGDSQPILQRPAFRPSLRR